MPELATMHPGPGLEAGDSGEYAGFHEGSYTELDTDFEHYGEFMAAVYLASKAGDHLLESQRDAIESESKGGSEVVTKAEEELERLVADYLGEEGYDVVGEETGGEASDGYFLVDPVDGSGNFSDGGNNYAFAISYIEDGETRASAVSTPRRHDLEDGRKLYAAAEGQGAFLRGRPLETGDGEGFYAKVSDRNRELRQDVESPVFNGLKSLEGNRVNSLGAATVELAELAEGSAAGVFQGAIHGYDVDAANLIVEEAGGEVEMFEGDFREFPALIAGKDYETVEEIKEVYRDEVGTIE
ncbi:MAG: inositol monophosphatase [Candidatus Nanohalobium sp.]